ncbi:MAG: hypothetical protein KatS3mg087_0653 [Patescibacteria group bacterium]|nr:MAG: hypothetical protein KatS3mg087_0653 [Patescibacteria group bacterium]
MRKSPFDVVYKYITNVAWESYNNPQPQVVPEPQPNPSQSASPLTPIVPQPQTPQLPKLGF